MTHWTGGMVAIGWLGGVLCLAWSAVIASPNTEEVTTELQREGEALSPWGAGDQRGAANLLGSEQVMRAVQLIEQGIVYPLGRMYERDIPLFGSRHFSLTIPGSPTGGPMGSNNLVYHDDLFSGELGQIGTQLDGLGHIGHRVDGVDLFYNGFTRDEIASAYGLRKLGIENAGVFVTKGVLVDIAKLKGVHRLDAGYVITQDDIEASLRRYDIKVVAGDAVLIRTGHGSHWKVDNAAYNAGEPGIGLGAARWLIDQGVTLVGADNWAVEAVPGEDPTSAFAVHQLLLMKNGVYILENLDLDGLAKDGVYEFAFILAPLPMRGASGSPCNPLAIR